jgi:pepF/M3 family oligoendopeptidase
MTPLFPAINSPERASSLERLKQLIAAFGTQIDTAESLKATSGPEVTAAFESLLGAGNELSDLALRNVAYLTGYTSVDSRDREAQAAASEIRILLAKAMTLRTRFTSWIGTLVLDALLSSSESAREHEFLLRKAGIDSDHLMHPLQEDLASELNLSGGSAWETMYDEVTSQIMVPFSRDGQSEESLPMSEIRNLASDADRDVRRRAFEAELSAWKQWETPIASALNGIKGQSNTLAARRNWDSVLDGALHQNHIDRETLDAMLGAARDAAPIFQRYFDAKAKALGIEQLAFYDLFAPLPAAAPTWTWDECVAFVEEQFTSYSEKMGGLVRRSIDEAWIDVGARPGKTDGAFCMPVGDGASRVLLNYNPSWDGVSTLAHELGHAYHNLCQEHVSPLRQEAMPMTLAETASTFCETILREAAIEQGTEEEQLAILEGSLQDMSQVVVDIQSRFQFEQAVLEARASRTLSPEEFCGLMEDAQRQAYGDGLDSDTLHPYMWAVKGHYYSASAAFYNYPYMFGLLFGLGLYARYQEDPETFKSGYDDLLASTGDSDAATLAARFGIDTRSREFWASSLGVIGANVDRFVELVDRRA